MILTVTLNAAIDKAYHMAAPIVNGTVMRVAKTCNSAGGKGLNVARVAKLCGADVKATGLVGGFNGMYLESLLDKDGIAHAFYHVNGETRSCINILDPAFGSTEYLEGGFTVSEEEEKGFLELFVKEAAQADVITISGSAPKGVSKDIYARMIEAVREMGKKVILDSSGEMLRTGITACPTAVKPNQEEMEMLFGCRIETREDVIRYAKKLYEGGIPCVIISMGKDGALLVCEEGIFLGKSPKLEAVNTVGCGDSMVAAFAAALSMQKNMPEAIRYAVAVAGANAMCPGTGNFETAVFEEIYEKTTVERM